ncbi:MAG: TonB-dependent receptor [Herminiimonas sp.]|nr:TonB-dependent receptor [Herminiimonas sp.]
MPTVSELNGATATTNSRYINDPNLKPEKSWTTELTAEKDLGNALLRLTFFTENVHDSLYAQTNFDPAANSNISRVQNVARIQTNGVELALSGNDLIRKGLDLSGSVTYADSRIKDNAGFVSTPGDTIGKVQPRVPVWRATALASYRIDPQWTTTFGIDNLNNYKYWNFHPYPQRSYAAEMRFDL